MAMKAEEALAIAKSYTKKSLEGQGALKGEDGVSPVISVNTSTADTYKLDITDKNGTITTPNLVGKQGLQGIQGEQGKPADNPIITENADNTEDVYKLDLTVGETVFTTKNIIGKQGLEGVSPSVTTNPDNTAEDYRLNITTKGGTFTTPNLRGPQGEIGPQGESAASAINPRGDYDANVEPHYTISDYITSAEGNTYVCKKDNPGNVAPTDGTVNDEFWQVLALRGAKGEAGKDGEKGADGVTFTPSIDESGVLSFTNNGGLENPEPIDIKGDNGVTFTPSIDADGYLSFTNDGNLENPEPIKVLGEDGVDGKDGIDGTTYIPSIGTVTTVESNADASAGATVDEETKEAVFNFAIPKGENGADGFSPIVTVTEIEGGHNVAIEDVNGVQNFEVLDGKDAYFTSLEQLGLTAPTTIGEAFNAMPDKSQLMLNVNNAVNADATVTDAPHNQGVLVINKHNNGRFSIEFNYSLGGNGNTIRKWIGTLKGSDGTGLNWKEVAYLNDHAMKSYSSLTDLELDTTATINDIIGKMANTSMFVYKTDVFDLTQYENLQFATVTIIKQSANRVQAIMTDKDTGNLYVGRMDSTNKIIGWTKIISEYSDPYACDSYTRLTGKEDLFTLPCGHYVTEKADTAYNYPITDSSTFNAHIYVLGHLNDPTNNKGYRIILYFDNKNRMYRINEWWGVFTDNGWQEIITKDYVDNAVSNSGNTFNGKEVKSITIDLSASAFQVKGTSLYKIALDNYISANTNVIKVEGYYVPPTDANSTYKDKRYIVHTSDSDRAGGIRYYDGSWTTCVCQSESGSKKGSGYAKIYYIN